MNIQQKKDECNALFEKAIVALEEYADPNGICKMLLDAASLLVEIGKASPADKPRCDKKAKLLLTVAKRFRENGIHSIAYYDLTGRILPANTTPAPKPEEKLNAEAIKGILSQKKIAPSMDEAVPSDYQFEWDNLPSISFDDVAGLDDVKDAVVRKVLLPLANPELYEGYVKKNGGGLLLYGSPSSSRYRQSAYRAYRARLCLSHGIQVTRGTPLRWGRTPRPTAPPLSDNARIYSRPYPNAHRRNHTPKRVTRVRD